MINWDSSKHDFQFFGDKQHTVSFFRFSNIRELYNAATGSLGDMGSEIDILDYAEKTQKTNTKELITRHSWKSWGLVAAGKIVIPPPSVKTSYQDVPGVDFTHDMTEWPDSRPHYGAREGRMDFLVEPSIIRQLGQTAWMNDIMAFLHGQRVLCSLEDDPEYLYSGRVSVGEYKDGSPCSSLTLNYNFEPFKQSIVHFGDKPLWNPYNISTNIVPIGLAGGSIWNPSVNTPAIYFRQEGIGNIRMFWLRDYVFDYSDANKQKPNSRSGRSVEVRSISDSRRVYPRIAVDIAPKSYVIIAVNRKIPVDGRNINRRSTMTIQNESANRRAIASFYDPRIYFGGTPGETDIVNIEALPLDINPAHFGSQMTYVGIDYREGLL